MFPSLLFLLLQLSLRAQQPLPPIGFWRDHLPYHSAIDVTEGTTAIVAATPYSLFSVDKSDKSFGRMSKTSGLSETGVNTILFDRTNEKLLIAYSNSNIDIIYRNDVINVPDLLRDNISGDKTIHRIYVENSKYYLSTGLGVVVIDGDRYEIKETWFIGTGGSQVKINEVSSDATSFYAATAEGLKSAPKTAILADHNNWQLLSGSNGLPPGECRQVISPGSKTIAQVGDTLFSRAATTWSVFYYDGWPVIDVKASGDKITVCQRRSSGESRVVLLDINGNVLTTLADPAFISSPRKAILAGSDVWIADEVYGLTRFDGSNYEKYQPSSPAGIATGELLVNDGIFYAAAGGVDASGNPQKNRDGFFIFKNENWTTVNNKLVPAMDTVLDIIALAIDRTDKSVWAGSFGGGLLQVKPNQQVEVFKQGILMPSQSDMTSYRAAGLAFDTENNLWISNHGASQPLVVKKADGTSFRFAPPFPIRGNAFSQIAIDINNYKWIVAEQGNGLVVYDQGASLEMPADDRWKLYRAGSGNGNLPDNNVKCVAIDKNGFAWVGTANGVAVIQCAQEVFNALGCEATWPVVQQGSFAGYLFAGEEVHSIAVDGADRKWIATKKGAWLISPTGEEVIYQFTQSNSPLLSDDVRKIAIDGKTGEVYFATAKGICSFRSTATEGSEKNENVIVFPNPVPPGYAGTIGIRGLVSNAVVKITELDGRLVYQGRANGGQFVWDGRDYKGRKISTGIYLVLISNDDRTEKKATKIIFINK